MCKNQALEATILSNAANTIKHLKNQQWKVSYYTMLIYGAFIATQQYLKLDSECHKWSLCLIVGTICIASAFLNWKLSCDLIENRKIVSKIYEHNNAQAISYGIKPDQVKSDTVEFMFYVASIIGLAITLAIIVGSNFN